VRVRFGLRVNQKKKKKKKKREGSGYKKRRGKEEKRKKKREKWNAEREKKADATKSIFIGKVSSNYQCIYSKGHCLKKQ